MNCAPSKVKMGRRQKTRYHTYLSIARPAQNAQPPAPKISRLACHLARPSAVMGSRMLDNPAFTDFVSRIRSGDDAAAEALVRHYEPLIRREVRLRIED